MIEKLFGMAMGTVIAVKTLEVVDHSLPKQSRKRVKQKDCLKAWLKS